ncbi:alpha/beta hydrolase [Xanthobacter autotrophicus]|uniref:alpha/beta hydrolase n=1 Tax=Xanthobacter TaxID=279 RepID=UPI0024ABA7C6|nr:alpha/beta hydrolase [Xanthobacter autotrophicus]MDI4663754.1 alpha/beta hydrolase [Xanthobacter autotrophicus]
MRVAATSVCLMLLAGCSDRPGPEALTPTSAKAPGAREHVILVASTRERDPRPGVIFNGERSTALNFAKVDLSVPPAHKSGEIEWPKKGAGDPATDMVVHEAIYRDTEQDFLRDMKSELARRPAGQKKVFIFVHGYNTQFSEALYRLAQMAHDADAPAVPVLFTWASRATTEAYVYDNNSATAARDNLEETIRLAFGSGADEVSIMAHSMGNWVTVEALRQIRISGKPVPQNKVGNIILAAPDIDVDVFKSQLKRFGKPAKPFVVIVSRDDKALGLSEFIAGKKQRLGEYSNDAELVELGAVVVDMTDVKALDSFNHGKFAQLAEMAPQLRGSVLRGETPGDAPASHGALQGVRISGLDRLRQQQPTQRTAVAAGEDTPAAAPAAQ